MRLYEWEAKALLARYGLPVPRGARWPEWPAVPGALVVKAQTLEGRRGLRGGICFCSDAAAVEAAVKRLLGSTIGQEIVGQIYLEERLEIAREHYVAIVVDRDAGAPALLLSAAGGVDVETQAERAVSMVLPLGKEVPRDALDELARRAGLDPRIGDALAAVVDALWRGFGGEEAELIEINPLVETPDGRLVAADARVVLDDGAAFRHPDRPAGGVLGTAFEARCASLGAVGIELEGEIAAIVSGAGLMMATIDLLTDAGGSLRAAVDLGGLVLREADEIADLLDAVADLEPRALLVNAFFQLATCDALARKLAVGMDRRPLPMPIVVRLRGRGLDEARRVLEPYDVVFADDLEAACRAVIGAAAQSAGARIS